MNEFFIRKAVLEDAAEIERLIAESVRGLSVEDYSARQIELSIKSVFGVDSELISDGTYFVAEADGKIVGCGGWSKRKTLYGASSYAHSRELGTLDPRIDAAKIRAFFIHPDRARKGIGKAILEICEAEAKSNGFQAAEMMSTLPGVRLYSACGYEGDERVSIPVGDGEEIICVKMSKKLA
ncbi:MAG: GNAT family N-acetyltransferase [Pyrinomonadaceae bacterium]